MLTHSREQQYLVSLVGGAITLWKRFNHSSTLAWIFRSVSFLCRSFGEGSQIGSDVDAKSDEDEARGGAQIDRSIEYRARQMSLHDCLRRYTRVEPLRWTEPYNCAECRRIKLEKQVSKAGATGTDPQRNAAALPPATVCRLLITAGGKYTRAFACVPTRRFRAATRRS